MRCSTGCASSASDVAQLAPAQRREVLVSEALRPAATTERWSVKKKDFAAATEKALASLTMIEAANAEEEALAIAVALREALETKNKTAALVTPDRALARRVAAALARWQVAVDNSAGYSLADTPAGVFARLAAEAALGGLEPVTLLALLKHPLLRLGQPAGAHAVAIATLERALLRGPRPRPGSDGLAQALATFRNNRDQLHRSDPRWLIADDEFDVAAELIARLGEALAPLERLKAGDHPLAFLATWHRDVVAALNPELGDNALAGVDTTARAFAELIESPSAAGLAVGKSDYPELFHAVVADRIVRRPETPRRAREHLGPFGSAPAGLRPRRARRPQRGHLAGRDAQRSLALRARCGARSASTRPNVMSASPHTTSHRALGAPEVILARAAKIAGSPTVTSRFVQRIAALAGEARWQEALTRGKAISTCPHARSSGAGEIGRAPGAEAESRQRARRGCRSPPSKTGCAILTPSTPAIFFACSRSMRSTPRRARATAAPSSTAPSAITPSCSPPKRRPIR